MFSNLQVDGPGGMETVQPTRGLLSARILFLNDQNSQIARNRKTRLYFRSSVRSVVLVCLTETSYVHKTESLVVVYESVEDRLGVEYENLSIRMAILEINCVEFQQIVPVRDRELSLFGCFWALYNNNGSAIRRRYSEEQEVPGAAVVEQLSLEQLLRR